VYQDQAEKFVPHPFKEGERMYKTGDTGYWLPDGNVVFTGRIDNQVKIRGYRIELGEIEATILQFGLIENAAVLIKEESEGRKYLVAYVMPREGYQQADLYSYLKEQLPDYMLPGMIIEMEKFPVNINGKLDVKALIQLGERSEITNEYVAPTNATEEKLVAIWQQLLQLNRLSIKDNFFEIGGDSLIILKLRQKIMEELNVQVNVVDLFSHTTIQDFASFISQDKEVVGEIEHDTKLETLKF
jgi:long-subunit acyl-CoA synthetase (AMP-forming)